MSGSPFFDKKESDCLRGRGLMKVFLVAFFLVISLAGCGRNIEKTEQSGQAEQTVQSTDKSEPIVRLVAGDMTGSGVIYGRTEEQLIIVTAAHVLEQVNESGATVEVVFGDEYSAETTSYIISRTSETAFVCIDLGDIPNENLEGYEPVLSDKVKYDELQEGDTMVFKGIVSEDGAVTEIVGEMLYPWIYVEDFEQYMMLIKGDSVPGMSGGGVFDSEGYFQGVLCGINEAGETAAVPLNVIIAEYVQYFF